jgi:hypothetical protein
MNIQILCWSTIEKEARMFDVSGTSRKTYRYRASEKAIHTEHMKSSRHVVIAAVANVAKTQVWMDSNVIRVAEKFDEAETGIGATTNSTPTRGQNQSHSMLSRLIYQPY